MLFCGLFGVSPFGAIVFGRPYITLTPPVTPVTSTGGSGDGKYKLQLLQRKRFEEWQYLSRRKRKKFLQEIRAAEALPEEKETTQKLADFFKAYTPTVDPIMSSPRVAIPFSDMQRIAFEAAQKVFEQPLPLRDLGNTANVIAELLSKEQEFIDDEEAFLTLMM